MHTKAPKRAKCSKGSKIMTHVFETKKATETKTFTTQPQSVFI